MGGAIYVNGNLDPSTISPGVANKSAEWNAFWDPFAVKWLFNNTKFDLILFPLDVTDQVKLDETFLEILNKQAQEYKYSNIVNSLYSLIKNQPFFEMWNTLTATYISRPDFFETPKKLKLEVVTEGFLQGTIRPSVNGRKAKVVLKIKDKTAFYNYVLNQLRRN